MSPIGLRRVSTAHRLDSVSTLVLLTRRWSLVAAVLGTCDLTLGLNIDLVPLCGTSPSFRIARV